jgi:hypothetical protein
MLVRSHGDVGQLSPEEILEDSKLDATVLQIMMGMQLIFGIGCISQCATMEAKAAEQTLERMLLFKPSKVWNIAMNVQL